MLYEEGSCTVHCMAKINKWVLIKDIRIRIVKLVLEYSLRSCDPILMSSHDAFVIWQ